MKKHDVRKNIQDGFSELSPDIFESILDVAEEEMPSVWKTGLEQPKKYAENQGGKGLEGRHILNRWDVSWGRLSKPASFACAGLAILCICLFGIFGIRKEATYLILDINPSVQVAIDDSYQVVSLKGLNQDGKDLLECRERCQGGALSELLDGLLEDAVEGEYLKEDSGILVTICSSRQEQYQDIEHRMGKSIDRKLKDMGICGVATAFLQGMESSEKSGRGQLESMLAKEYGLDENLASQMSVMELLQFCREDSSFGVTFSSDTDVNWDAISETKQQESIEDAQQTSGKLSVEENAGQGMSQQEETTQEKNEQTVQETEDEAIKKKDENEPEPSASESLKTNVSSQPQDDADVSIQPEAPAQPAPEASPPSEAVQATPETNVQDTDQGSGADKKRKKKKREKDKKKKDKKNSKDKNKAKEKDKHSNQGKDGDQGKDKKDKKDKEKNKNGKESKDKNKKPNQEMKPEKVETEEDVKESKDKDANKSQEIKSDKSDAKEKQIERG